MTYSPNKKPAGYFDKLLAIDCETTGVNINGDDASEGYQAVSWGVIVADANTFMPIDELYVEIKWNDECKQLRKDNPNYGKPAERIHGLTYDYLEINGVTEEQAVNMIGNLIVQHWGPTSCIKTLGHNVHMFDVPVLRSMFKRQGIRLKFGNRHYDSSSLAFGTVGSFNSDDLFNTMGFEERSEHNALDDAHMALSSFRLIKALWKGKVGVLSYD